MHILKKHPLFTAVAALVIVGAIYMLTRTSTPQYVTAAAERTNLTEEVSATGSVEPDTSATLGFEVAGTIAHVYADVGDHVGRGQAIASLDTSSVRTDIAQAQATLAAAQAKLAELKTGSTQQQIDVSKQKVANAQVALQDAENNARTVIGDAYTRADDAIHVKTDPIFYNPRTTTPTLSFSPPDQQLKTDIETERLAIEQLLTSWNASLTQDATVSDMLSKLADASSRLNEIASFLEMVTRALNTVVPSTSLTQTTINTYTSNVSTARTSIQTALTNTTTATQTLRTASSNLALAQQELSVTTASATPETIAAQQAEVDKAQASLDGLSVKLSKSVLRAPFSGTVTSQDAKIGQIAQAGTTLVGLISESQYKITANIPEVDIANVAVGQHATITLDAYGDNTIFHASVTKIDPAAVVIEGVPTYKTTLVFTQKDTRVKPGMTANINIITAEHDNVIAIPARAVTTTGNAKTVNILANGASKTVTVTTGLSSYDGRIEIVSGVHEGDTVILSQK